MIAPEYTHRGLAGLNEQIAAAVGDAMFGKPGSAQEKQRQAFFAGTLSKTATEFVSSPEGKAVVNKVTVYAAIPAFAAGMLVGWMLWKRRK